MPKTSSPSATLQPELAPFADFAHLVDAAVKASDAGFFSSRAVEISMTCDGSEQLGPCSGQAVGAMISGVPGTAWKSDAYALTPRDDYRALLTEWFGSALPDEGDDLGDGSPRLAAIAREDSSGEYYAIATLIDDTGPATGIQRQSRTFRFAAANGDWQLAGDILGAVSYTSLDWLSGACSECYDYFERWP